MTTKSLTRAGNGHLVGRTALNDFFAPWSDWFNEPAWEHSFSMPAVNISETKKNYIISVAAPGLSKDDFEVRIDRNILTISAGKEDRHAVKGSAYKRCEYNYASFSRSLTLPQDVKHAAPDAEYRNGELVITLPRRAAKKNKSAKVAVK